MSTMSVAVTTLPLYPSRSTEEGDVGTTLEQTFGLDISHTPLWSAEVAIEHPETIVDAHLAFLRAGARMILTSTFVSGLPAYQYSLSTFQLAGYSAADAHRLMARCVQLAEEARARFCAERNLDAAAAASVKIALSLGPYGAGLSPAQEFDGFYPPPFGPRGYAPGAGNTNTFARREDEEAAVEALAQFHLGRLRAITRDAGAWRAIDAVAFETVPLVREARAVRVAMGRLFADAADSDGSRGGVQRKPWWVSFVFPDGRFPETVPGPHGEELRHVSVRAIVAAAFQDTTSGDGEPLPRPSALGINCTNVDALPELLAEMEDALREILLAGHASSEEEAPEWHSERPWLLLYPNGGDVYDPVSQTWVVKGNKGVWAEKLRSIVTNLREEHFGAKQSVWAGVVVGGCCRTGPEDIALLSKLLQER
ncbi:Homocysteine S-methyltransferase [Mycena pura]|uniref:Homocysteine S-methyltransferase n=1 Tax=Mycena pura TaxID=153505 RepID=A0AAD6VHC0_9AGAR|nr:Homocysteine S-methyltransferase [Mycena pura]